MPRQGHAEAARLDNDAARRLFLHRHALAEPPTGPARGADLLALIRRLGFVQVDSLRTVERAHDMILFSRRSAYRPTHLPRLIEADRALFEHWTHDAAVIPTEFYRHWHLRFARNRHRLRGRWEKWHGTGFDRRFDAVLDEVRARGAVSTMDIGQDEARSSGGWWDWNPSKTALEYHWHCGALAVCHRTGFRKHYDLAERVIPEAQRLPVPTEAESRAWFCAGALDRLGFATAGEIAAFWAVLRPAEAQDWARQERLAGRLTEIAVQDADGGWRRMLARPDVLEAARAAPEPPRRLRVLSPFDPALRDRKRALRLFGFDYRIEIFTPAAKRKYGYYVFPLLEGARLVGRIDMAANRRAGVLEVTALWPEAGLRWGAGRQARLEAELARVARFAGLEAGVAWAQGWLRQAL